MIRGGEKLNCGQKMEIKDDKTLVIREICYGTTTESLIRSIDEAAKRGKIKIEAINDYTSSQVEIEIKLPRGQYADEMLDALYGFTECEVSLTSQVIVIKDNLPWETDVHEILGYNATQLVAYLKRELEIERDRILERIFYKTLERIFIENRLYKPIEKLKTLEAIHSSLEDSLKPYRKKLLREPTEEDRDKLLQIPIRRISQFDIDRNKEEIALLEENLRAVEKHLRNVKKFAIEYLKGLIAKYGASYPRKTKIKAIEEIDRRSIETKEIKVGFDPQTGFAGTKVSGPIRLSCTNFDKIVVFSKDGTYKVTNIPEKQYFEEAIWFDIADKKTIVNVVYKTKLSNQTWAKRFIVEKFIMDKAYRYFEEGAELLHISTNPKAVVELHFGASAGKKAKPLLYALKDAPLKGAQTRGIRIATQKVKKVLSGTD
jgi:topoisomerase-4 subunit A